MTFFLSVILILLASCNNRIPTPTSEPPPTTPTTWIAPSPSPSPETPTGTPAGAIALTPAPTRATSMPPAQFDIVVDSTKKYQTLEGFGATHGSLVIEHVGDTLGPLRAQAIEAAYGEVGLNTGNIEGALLESPGSYEQRANDDNDLFHFNWAGFQTKDADNVKQYIIDPAARLGFNDYYLAQKINVRWASPWLDDLRSRDYDRYLDEAAEQVAAGMIYWRDRYEIVSRYEMLFNEPLSGTPSLLNGNTQDVVDLVKRVGDRLRREGFVDVKFVIPNEETEEKSLATATAILSDPAARQYVGAIGYHPYPYGSIYASISNILNTSGKGRPDAGRIHIRNRLRDLGKQYGIPVWMTEVSHGGVDPLSFDALRGRAIHIHDELVYADAAAYYGMVNLWDTVAQKEHFGGGDLLSPENEGTIVFVDTDKEIVYISGIGYAIGHYARWVKRGAVRIEATSREPLVLVTAFQDSNSKRIILVFINNALADKDLTVQVNGVTLTGTLAGEQSTAAARWQPLVPFAPATSTTFSLQLPALSVMTIAGQIQ